MYARNYMTMRECIAKHAHTYSLFFTQVVRHNSTSLVVAWDLASTASAQPYSFFVVYLNQVGEEGSLALPPNHFKVRFS